eukprot:SAG22_NODE_991_length_6129_cov_8.370813_12_plen_70_part_00
MEFFSTKDGSLTWPSAATFWSTSSIAALFCSISWMAAVMAASCLPAWAWPVQGARQTDRKERRGLRQHF